MLDDEVSCCMLSKLIKWCKAGYSVKWISENLILMQFYMYADHVVEELGP